MDYVIVRANGPEAEFSITSDFNEALGTYRGWLTAYLDETGDEFAREQLDRLDHAGNRLRGGVIEFRAPRYGADGTITRVLALGVLGWPAIWRLPPPQNIARDWGRIIRRLDQPWGVVELRGDGQKWRLFWVDARFEDAFATSRIYTSAAEAAANLAFIDAAWRRHTSPHPETRVRRDGGK
jgi:hypothetical protein